MFLDLQVVLEEMLAVYWLLLLLSYVPLETKGQQGWRHFFIPFRCLLDLWLGLVSLALISKSFRDWVFLYATMGGLGKIPWSLCCVLFWWTCLWRGGLDGNPKGKQPCQLFWHLLKASSLLINRALCIAFSMIWAGYSLFVRSSFNSSNRLIRLDLSLHILTSL